MGAIFICKMIEIEYGRMRGKRSPAIERQQLIAAVLCPTSCNSEVPRDAISFLATNVSLKITGSLANASRKR